MLHPDKQKGNGGQQRNNRQQHAAYAQRNLFTMLFRKGFRQNLTENQHQNRDYYGGNPGARIPQPGGKKHRGNRGYGNVHQVVANQNA